MHFSPPTRSVARWLAPLAILWTTTLCTTMARAAPTHAPRPQWPQNVVDTFYLDAREHLVGQRPEAPTAPAAETDGTAATSRRPAEETFVWSQWVDSDTLETEIKRIALNLQEPLKSLSLFQSGGYIQCRRDFSMLAVLLAVIHQFDEDVRWQRDAAALRDRFARSGFHCKVASQDTYTEASRLRDQLLDLLRGNHPRMEKPTGSQDAAQIADRAVLMQRMEQSLKQKITPHMGSKGAFRKQAETVGHEAGLLAMLAQWIGREGYEYWDDESYALQARLLGNAATELAAASRQSDYSQARQAAGSLGQACGNCHDDYRE